jgi:tyrosine-protein kinase Etk/Wzc
LSEAQTDLEKVVSIDNGAKDGLITISVTDRDPHRAAEMANGYVQEFKKFTSTIAVTEASQRRLFFGEQLSQAKDDLANAEEELKKTEQKTGLIQPDSQARAVIESAAQLRAQITAKEVEIQGLRSFATGENPDLQMAQQELAALRSEQVRMGAGDASNSFLLPKGNMQAVSLEYVRKLRDVKYYETIFDLLARQYEIAKVDEAREGAVVQVVDRAIVPDTRSFPKRKLIVIGAVVLGLLIGVVWAFIREGYDRLSRNPAEAMRIASLKQMLGARKRQ